MKTFSVFIGMLICMQAFCQKNKFNNLISFIDSSSGETLYGYKNVEGKIIIPAMYEAVMNETMSEESFVFMKSKWLLIDRKNNILLTPYFFDNGPDYVVEGLFRFVENNKIGFANVHRVKIIPATFDFVSPFKNGFAAFNMGGTSKNIDAEHTVWNGGLWGFINKHGEVVIAAKYKQVYEFTKKYCQVWMPDDTHLLIDKKGKTIKVLKN